MAFFIGDRKKSGQYPSNDTSGATLPVTGLTRARKVFDSDNAGGYDSDLLNLSMGSSRWKKKWLEEFSDEYPEGWYNAEVWAEQLEEMNRSRFRPYGTKFRDPYQYYDQSFLMTDPSNFTISDNLNSFSNLDDKYDYTYFGTPRDGLSNDSNDGRGSTWAIPLFHNNTYYTGRDGHKYNFAVELNANQRVGFQVRDYYGESDYSRLVQGINDFRPSSLLEPEQWSMRRLNVGSTNNTDRPYVFDQLRHKNVQYLQLLTNHDRTLERKILQDVGYDNDNHAFKYVRKSIYDFNANNVYPDLIDDDPAYQRHYGKVLGYVLEPGRSIIADSDSDGTSYLNWFHNDAMGKGKWAGMTVPNYTQIDSSRGLGIRRSYGRSRRETYLDKGYQYSYWNGTNTVNVYVDTMKTWNHMAFGANEVKKADPYVGMTIGSPCMLTYFGRYPTDNETKLGDWSNVPENKFPMVAALGKNTAPGKGSSDLWPRGNSRIWYQESPNEATHLLQDIIDSSTVCWSSGKGNAPLQEREASHAYPYVMADYMPSRTNYNRKGENVLYDTQMRHDVETSTQGRYHEYPSGYYGYTLVLDTKDAWGDNAQWPYPVVSPINFTTNDWNDSVAASNVKDVMVINNFDSDLIALHMVRDWDCWRR